MQKFDVHVGEELSRVAGDLTQHWPVAVACGL